MNLPIEEKESIKEKNLHLLLVCASGGHLYELYCLREFWMQFKRTWVTFDTDMAKSLLKNEKVIMAYQPTTRNIINLFRNFWLALNILWKQKPNIIISTGSGIAIPFFYTAKLFGIKTIYIESIARVNSLSVTGRIVYPIANHFLVQWPELSKALTKAEYKGQVI